MGQELSSKFFAVTIQPVESGKLVALWPADDRSIGVKTDRAHRVRPTVKRQHWIFFRSSNWEHGNSRELVPALVGTRNV